RLQVRNRFRRLAGAKQSTSKHGVGGQELRILTDGIFQVSDGFLGTAHSQQARADKEIEIPEVRLLIEQLAGQGKQVLAVASFEQRPYECSLNFSIFRRELQRLAPFFSGFERLPAGVVASGGVQVSFE